MSEFMSADDLLVKFDMLTDKQIISFKNNINKDLIIPKDQVQDKLLQLPIICSKYNRIYTSQQGILKNINTYMTGVKRRRLHYYKYDSDFIVDNATQLLIYVDGDEEMCEVNIIKDRQETLVNFIKLTLNDLSKVSYLIRSYVDLEKLRNGVQY